MKVSIVCRNSKTDHRILTRLARQLAAGTTWKIAPHPDPKADVNYFFPYLEWEACPTRTAGWFTHRDEGRQAKVAMWESIADGLALRTTSAALYVPELQERGPTALITPPLDRQKFRPGGKRKPGPRPVVGTSGYTYPGGRKGEQLLNLLAASELGKGLDLRASGRGWPVPTVQWPWEKLEEFYWGLDVYLCTSLIEGVGYGPMEAMACGLPVVVPRGVGIFDELPDVPGLYRYRRGDYGDMERALREALEGRPDRAALRDATECFSEQAWIEGHIQAFETAFEPKPATVPPTASLPAIEDADSEVLPWRGRAGLYVVAYGDPSRNCAVKCIESFQRHMPGIPVALVSDRALGPEDILIQQPEVDIGARSHKVRIYDLAPADWHYVMYLDADTEVTQPIDFLFDALQDGWDMVICKNPSRFALAANMVRPDYVNESQETFKVWGTDQMMQLFGGMFTFRRCAATRGLFAAWHTEWQRYGGRDQAALLRAYWQHPLRLMCLGNEWNLDPKYEPKEKGIILHYPQTARRWTGLIHGRTDGEQAWARVAEWERARAGARG